MGPEDAVPTCCPFCKHCDRIVRAVDVPRDASDTTIGGVAVELPVYESWSVLLMGAIGFLFLSAFATGGNSGPSTAGGNFAAEYLMLVASVLSVLGLLLTRRNVARMRAVEDRVRQYHEYALYCRGCTRIHFPTVDLPPGLRSGVAWTVPDYRRELWRACGFAKVRAGARRRAEPLRPVGFTTRRRTSGVHRGEAD